MTPRWRGTRRRLLWILGLLIAHSLLAWWLAERQVVAVLLAAGSQTPWVPALTALCFIALRMLVILGLPGLLLYAAVAGVLDGRAGSRPLAAESQARRTVVP